MYREPMASTPMIPVSAPMKTSVAIHWLPMTSAPTADTGMPMKKKVARVRRIPTRSAAPRVRWSPTPIPTDATAP